MFTAWFFVTSHNDTKMDANYLHPDVCCLHMDSNRWQVDGGRTTPSGQTNGPMAWQYGDMLLWYSCVSLWCNLLVLQIGLARLLPASYLARVKPLVVLISRPVLFLTDLVERMPVFLLCWVSSVTPVPPSFPGYSDRVKQCLLPLCCKSPVADCKHPKSEAYRETIFTQITQCYFSTAITQCKQCFLQNDKLKGRKLFRVCLMCLFVIQSQTWNKYQIPSKTLQTEKWFGFSFYTSPFFPVLESYITSGYRWIK